MPPSPRQPESVFRLTDAGEPFRLLFPLGTVLGLVGVALWPAFAWGWWPVYPAAAHTAIMIHGFLAAFVFGFLGTAFPRLLDVRRFGLRTTLILGAGPVVLTLAHLAGAHLLGLVVFFMWLTGFLGLLGSRFRESRDLPPPGFLLVAFGMASAWVGTLLLMIDGAGAPLAPWAYTFARLLAWQGFLLFPILGIGAFLLPRFFGMPSKQAFPELSTPSRAWMRRAAFAGACGAGILGGFLLEALGQSLAGNLLRAVAVTVYVLREIPLHRTTGAGGDLALGLRVALLALPLAFVAVGLLPFAHLALLHILYMTGFGLITFIVGSRVLFGHSGQSARFTEKLPFVKMLVGLTVLALAVRMGADFLTAGRFAAYAWAGLIWMGGVLVWAFAALPRVRYPDDE